jgi:hypothetical protein
MESNSIPESVHHHPESVHLHQGPLYIENAGDVIKVAYLLKAAQMKKRKIA